MAEAGLRGGRGQRRKKKKTSKDDKHVMTSDWCGDTSHGLRNSIGWKMALASLHAKRNVSAGLDVIKCKQRVCKCGSVQHVNCIKSPSSNHTFMGTKQGAREVSND